MRIAGIISKSAAHFGFNVLCKKVETIQCGVFAVTLHGLHACWSQALPPKCNRLNSSSQVKPGVGGSCSLLCVMQVIFTAVTFLNHRVEKVTRMLVAGVAPEEQPHGSAAARLSMLLNYAKQG